MGTREKDKIQGTKGVMKIDKSKTIQWPKIKEEKAKDKQGFKTTLHRKLRKSKISNTYESSLKIRIAFID